MAEFFFSVRSQMYVDAKTEQVMEAGHVDSMWDNPLTFQHMPLGLGNQWPPI